MKSHKPGLLQKKKNHTGKETTHLSSVCTDLKAGATAKLQTQITETAQVEKTTQSESYNLGIRRFRR